MADAPEAELIKGLRPQTKALILVAEAQAGQLPCGQMAALIELLAADPPEKAALAAIVTATLAASGVPAGRIADLEMAFGATGAARIAGDAAEAEPARSKHTTSVKSLSRARFDAGAAGPPEPPAPPVAPGPPEPPAQPAAEADGPAAADAPTVLVADDDGPFRTLVRVELENEGFNVIEAADGLEAWQQLQASPVSALVLDMKMPGLHGLDILSRLAEAGGTLPVVICTAYEQITEGDLVVDSYLPLRILTKPVDARHLVETVLNLLAERD
jgi:CheY-like chemotaxis protein